MNLYEKHSELLKRAIKANHERTFYAAYQEHPSPNVYGETADADGQEAFKKQLNSNFTELLQSNEDDWRGSESSPYLNDFLNIKYPFFSVEKLTSKAQTAFHGRLGHLPCDYRRSICQA